MRFILLIKLYKLLITERLYKILTQWCPQHVSHEPPPASFQATRDSKYYVYTVSDKRKLNIKKEFFQIADHTLTCINFNSVGCKLKKRERGGGGGGWLVKTNLDPRKTCLL